MHAVLRCKKRGQDQGFLRRYFFVGFRNLQKTCGAKKLLATRSEVNSIFEQNKTGSFYTMQSKIK
jgi:hypothetical protein